MMLVKMTDVWHQGRNGAPKGKRSFEASIEIARIMGTHRAQSDTPERLLLQERAHNLRSLGLSYPQIAQVLGVSLGLAWNMINQ